MNTTKVKVDRNKTHRKVTGHRQEMKTQDYNPRAIHVYLGAHDQERPETRLTR